jgi:hypothetical protein
MRKYYRIVLINRETNERRMMFERFTSRKKAIEVATTFCSSVKANANFEVKEVF